MQSASRRPRIEDRRRVRREHSARAQHRAFSIIELLAVLGIIMLLLALLMPMAGRAMDNSRLVRDSALARQNAMALGAYAQDWAEVFPIADQYPAVASFHWYRALRRAGHLQTNYEADPEGWKRFGTVRFAMSMCLVYDPELMSPLRPVQPDQTRSLPVRHSQLAYPSSKGILLLMSDGRGRVEDGGTWFCCTARWKVPVAMGDASVAVGDYLDFNLGRPVAVNGALGIPVFSTWGGYRARDR
jgi:type II secretory pathway pseudopilin PulG